METMRQIAESVKRKSNMTGETMDHTFDTRGIMGYPSHTVAHISYKLGAEKESETVDGPIYTKPCIPQCKS